MTTELANLFKTLWPVLGGVIYIVVLLHYGQWRDRQMMRMLGWHHRRISRLESAAQGD